MKLLAAVQAGNLGGARCGTPGSGVRGPRCREAPERRSAIVGRFGVRLHRTRVSGSGELGDGMRYGGGREQKRDGGDNFHSWFTAAFP